MKRLILAVTGGIASGKSFVCQRLAERGFPVFSCDDEARRLMVSDDTLRQRLQALIGLNAYKDDGSLNKIVVASFIKSGGKEAVDALVHPAVRRAFWQWVTEQNSNVVIMECALLFESGFEVLADKAVLVSAPENVRIKRLMQRNGIDEGAARSWMALQMPEEEKMRRADFVICNDGKSDLEQQIDKLLGETTFLRIKE